MPVIREREPSGPRIDPFLERMRAGRVTPIISDPALVDLAGGDSAGLVEAYARYVGYPLSSGDGLARMVKFRRASSRLADHDVRYDYLNFVKNYFYELAKSKGADRALLEEAAAQIDELTASRFATLLGYPRLDRYDTPFSMLANLPVRVFLTTSPYTFLEEALRSVDKAPVSEVCRWRKELDNIDSAITSGYRPSETEPLVFHLFGLDAYPDSLVLTDDDSLAFLAAVSAGIGNEQADRLPALVRRALFDDLLVLGFATESWEYRIVNQALIKLAGRESGGRGVFVANVVVTNEAEKVYLEDSLGRDLGFDVFWGSLSDYLQQLWSELKGEPAEPAGPPPSPASSSSASAASSPAQVDRNTQTTATTAAAQPPPGASPNDPASWQGEPIQSGSAPDGEGIRVKGPSSSARPAPAPQPPSDRVPRIANVSFPSTVRVTDKAIPLVVQLVAIAGADTVAVAQGSASVGLLPGDLVISVSTFDFDVEETRGGTEVPGVATVRRVQVDPTGDSEPVTFNLAPVEGAEPGAKRISIEFIQNNKRQGLLGFNVQVVDERSPADQGAKAVDANFAVGQAAAHAGVDAGPDLNLRVTLQGNVLSYSLLSADGRYQDQPLGQKTLPADPRAYFASISGQLSDLASRPFGEDGRRTPEQRAADENASVTQLQVLGVRLWNELIPEPLQQIYRDDLRQNYAGKTLVVTSDEPWIPWEMIRPTARERGRTLFIDPPLCEQFGLSRWLAGPAAPDQLIVKRAVLVAPDDNLLWVQEERNYFSKSISGETIENLAEVSRELRHGTAQLIHFSGHGRGSQGESDEPELRLGDDSLRPSYLLGQELGLYQSRPLVFLNAVESGDPAWARAFLDLEATAFIGALWAINDKLATQFAIAFYDRLFGLNGQRALSLGEAFHAARQDIKALAPGNPTWLAYVLYGDPTARVYLSIETAAAPGATAPPAPQSQPQPVSKLAAALVVGINDYPERSKISKLRFAVADVNALADWLQGGLHVPPAQITRLTDAAATKKAILEGTRRVAAAVGEGQEGLIQFSGMSGHFPGEGEMSFESAIAAFDSTVEHTDSFVRHSELLDALQGCPGHITLILDVCHDGSLVLTRRAPENVTVLAASRDDETAMERPQDQHGLFTAALLDVLKGWTPDLTWGEAYLKVFGQVVSTEPKQHPMLIGDGRRRVFGGGALGTWRPQLPVLKAQDGELELYASPALQIPEKWAAPQPANLALDALGSAADVLELYAVGGAHLRFRPQEAFADYVKQKLEEVQQQLSVIDGVPPLRVALETGTSDALGGRASRGIVTFVEDNAGADLVVRTIEHATDAGQAGWVVTLPQAGAALTAPLEQLDGLIPLLESLATFRYLHALRNDSTQVDSLPVSLALATGATTVAPGEAFTVVLSNGGTQAAFVSLWLLTGDCSMRQLHPARSDCDILYGGATLSLSLSLDQVAGSFAMLKLVATSEPHDLRMFEQEANLHLSADLFAWLAPADSEAGRVEAAAAEANTSAPPAERSAGERLLAGQGLKAKLWKPGQTIRIRFLGGDPALVFRVMSIASSLTEYANLHFQVVGDGDGEVRIAFDRGWGGWSYCGIDALSAPPNQQTMNLGWLTAELNEFEARKLVLREFGHMLGLVNAHQTANPGLPWDRDAVIRAYGGPPNNWSVETIEANMLRSYRPEELAVAVPFDPASIMAYAFPSNLFQGGFSMVGTQGELTEIDKQVLAALYPYTPEQSYAQRAG